MSAAGRGKARILHLHSTFAAGGKELRSVRLINAFGPKVSHTIVSAEPERMEAAQHILRQIPVTYPRDFPALKGKPTPGRLQRLARAMQGYDLVLTYNWGAMNAVMAHTAFRDAFRLPALIHHEDGFNEDERKRLKPIRNWFRKIALGRANGLVVPSETLEGIALQVWEQPIGRVKHIPNGIDTKAFAKRPKPDALRGVVKRKGEFWVGTLAGLRPVKNLPRLVRAFRHLPEDWHLVIVGEGPERDAIRAEADEYNIGHRVHLPGFAPHPERYVGLLDIFALSSDSEQFPVSLVEAMAAGVPVVAPAVGDVADMVSEANAPLIGPAGDESALAQGLAQLAGDAALRERIGYANREKARASYDEKPMIAAYRRLYSSAMDNDALS
ncbi:glycosyltransferase family 4 protein [Altererythrobacter sp. C41]|uniref:glycosyltransferase family 4 protein n=1 Tax=Altererythrobacter sp. C41 TaxID=2806021 RepID=UPI0019334733|nr:glycosyltransferase family 4 protein [Altererythrobacter sp. C41]MBM0168953.1 glycosyltransferase family 4 protein [Altererythrobacter sp. C41]